ncbi:MAG TPA: hypothetical protein VFK08_05130, partial [Rhodanobacteraceae bacterium]|nr:hypothetical protein [Rhodanobacteraceae bacterium]
VLREGRNGEGHGDQRREDELAHGCCSWECLVGAPPRWRGKIIRADPTPEAEPNSAQLESRCTPHPVAGALTDPLGLAILRG